MERDLRAEGADEQVEELLARLVARVEQGEARAAVLEDLCAVHPDRADTLQRRAEILDGLGLLSGGPEASLPERLGPFRLGQRLGEGGMGVVYEAEQEDLGRAVALKVIRPENLFFTGARERFRREVETVARLQHPGIVPVYTVGEERGIPYFAMELVHGCSLGAVIDQLRGKDPAELTGADLGAAVAAATPDGEDVDIDGWLFAGTWEQACLRIVREVADSLEYAHRRGVVHRDLKPSNIMIALGSDQAQVKLLDFGLASTRGDESLTGSGSRLGSLPYMAPEQARGEMDRVGPVTDVHALGVTLYELLTLRRPYDGRSEPEVLAAIQQGDRKRPREHHRALSREAETVCLSAMETEPSDRYPSTADLARDLGNVLDRRPIEARRTAPGLRLLRWVQRRPAEASAVVLGLLLVVGAPLFFLWRERQAAEVIRGHLDRAEANFTLALESVDRMLSRVGAEELRFVPRMEPVREELLNDAVELTESLLASETESRQARLATAETHVRLASLMQQLGRVDEAEASWDRATDMLESLAAESDDDARVTLALTNVFVAKTEGLRSLGRADDARAAQARAAELAAGLVAAHPDDPEVHESLAASAYLLAWLDDDQAAPENEEQVRRAERTWEETLDLLEVLADRWPQESRFQGRLGEACSSLGLLLLRQPGPAGPRPRERALLERSVDHFGRAIALAEGDDVMLRFKRQTARLTLAGVHKREGDFGEAEALVRDTVDPLRSLTESFPGSPKFKIELASAYNQLGSIADWQERHAEAAEEYAATVELLHEVLEQSPDLHEIRNKLGISEMNLGAKYMRLDRNEEALPHLLESVKQHQEAVRLYPGQPAYRNGLRWSYTALSDGLANLGDWRNGKQAALGIAASIPDDWESHTRAAAHFASHLLRGVRRDPALTPAERRDLDAEFAALAVAHLRTAIELGFPHPAEIRTAGELDPLRGSPTFQALVEELPPAP